MITWMAEQPDDRYGCSEGFPVAYFRQGKGVHVIIFAAALLSNIEFMWKLPEFRATEPKYRASSNRLALHDFNMV